MISGVGPFARQWRRRCEPGTLCAQQRMQPQFTQQDLLMGCLPEGADLLGLATGGKGLLLHTQCKECFEVVGLRISASCLPFRYCAPGDPKHGSQARLRQADVRPQRQYHLAECIIALIVSGPLHGRSPFRVTHLSETV